MRITTILGARPQFIKASVLSRLMAKNTEIHEEIIHTGQHYDWNLSEQFFEELQLPSPNYCLNIGSDYHGAQTGEMLKAIENILMDSKPDYVIVYGDTNSTLAGALAAAKLHIPVIHVEAGLRSFNTNMAEEINRKCVDHLSSILFVPTKQAFDQLIQEGIAKDKIYLVGDILYDLVRLQQEFSLNEAWLQQWSLTPGDYYLCTIHRAENTDYPKRLSHIIDMLNKLAEHKKILLVLHPRTQKYLKQYDLFHKVSPNIIINPPLGFAKLMLLQQKSAAVITDSGGIQKEAFFQKVPCITLRDETEWTELITLGCNLLISPANRGEVMAKQAIAFLSQSLDFSVNPYGDGYCGEKILAVLKSLNQGNTKINQEQTAKKLSTET